MVHDGGLRVEIGGSGVRHGGAGWVDGDVGWEWEWGMGWSAAAQRGVGMVGIPAALLQYPRGRGEGGGREEERIVCRGAEARQVDPSCRAGLLVLAAMWVRCTDRRQHYCSGIDR